MRESGKIIKSKAKDILNMKAIISKDNSSMG